MIKIRAMLGFRLLVLGVFILSVSVMLWRALSTSGEVETDVSKRPQRMLAYVVTPDAGPSFSMSEISGRVRFLSSLHLEAPLSRSEYTPLKTFNYGLKLRVLEAGNTLLEHEIWYTTRKSKIGGKGERWERESAYYPVGDIVGEPCDPRMTEIDLASWTGPNRTLEIRSIAAPGDTPPQLNAVAYAAFERDEGRVEWLSKTVGPESVRRASRDLGLRNWSVPRPKELARMYRAGWRRQSTVGASDVRPLFTTDYRAKEYNSATEGFSISKARAMSLNVKGPATVRFAAIANVSTKPVAGIRELGYDAALERVTWREKELRLIPFADVSAMASATAGDPRFAKYEVDELRTVSLEVSGASDEGFRIVAIIDKHDAVLGEPRMHRSPIGGFMVRPDAKSFSAWMIDARQGAEYLLAEEGEGSPDVLLLTARVPTRQAASVLRYEFVGSDVSGEITPEGKPSRFEVAVNPSVELEPTALTEPTTLRLVVPAGATHLKLSGQGQHFVGVSVLTLGDDEEMTRKLRPPYDEPPQGLSWRYAPSEVTPWFTIHPEDALSLEAMKRRWRIESQVRLKPDFGSVVANRSLERLSTTTFADVFEIPIHEQKQGVASTIAPSIRSHTRTLHELSTRQPRAKRDVEAIGRVWDATYQTVFPADHEWACVLLPGKSLSLSVNSASSGVGSSYEVYWNDELVRRRLMRTQRDTMLVSTPESTGRLRFEWNAEHAPRLTTNCRPIVPEPHVQIVRVRRVYALTARRPIDLSLTSTELTWLLNSVSYSVGSASVQVTVDGGVPARRQGQVDQITAATRILDWQAPTQPAWLDGDIKPSLRGAVSHAIPIGADWKPGRHKVRLRLSGRDGTVWMRFFRID